MAGRDVQVLHRPRTGGEGDRLVGLYLPPPENAIVLCVDEKSQIRALDRTGPRRCCRCSPACSSAAPTTTNGTAPVLPGGSKVIEVATGKNWGDLYGHREWQLPAGEYRVVVAKPGDTGTYVSNLFVK